MAALGTFELAAAEGEGRPLLTSHEYVSAVISQAGVLFSPQLHSMWPSVMAGVRARQLTDSAPVVASKVSLLDRLRMGKRAAYNRFAAIGIGESEERARVRAEQLALEQQLVLIRAQLSDLKGFRVTLYDDIEHLNQLRRSDFDEKILKISEKRDMVQ